MKSIWYYQHFIDETCLYFYYFLHITVNQKAWISPNKLHFLCTQKIIIIFISILHKYYAYFLKLSEFSIHFYDFIVLVVTVVELELVKLCITTTNINDALVVLVNYTTDFYTPSFLIIHMTQHFTTAYEFISLSDFTDFVENLFHLYSVSC